jgi:superfamily II DNA or RNA helicase
MTLRFCQTEALKTIRENRKTSTLETNLSLCTGAGKSIIIREISQENKRRILVFPWLDLMIQYFDVHKEIYSSCNCIRYYATEGTLPHVERLSDKMNELQQDSYVILTTYTSAPNIYGKLKDGMEVDILIHDEAHRIERPDYKSALTPISGLIRHTVNLSATLPSTKTPHYRYSLLRGIKDGVVRDFHMELFLCVAKERNETKLLQQILEKLKSLHKEVKLLIYTAEANTENNDSSSVKTFIDKHADLLRQHGYWIEGIRAETKDRKKLLREFEKHRECSILVSCKTLSEGIDLKNANCMLPWDPSSSPIDNIQRIGRCLRLLKDQKGEFKKEQRASTVLIPIFLNEEKYKNCEGDREKIDSILSKEISEGDKGNFRPIVNVCTALKEELAEDDPDLFNRLINWPAIPKVSVNYDLIECVANQCNKSVEDVIDQVVENLQEKVDEDALKEIQEGEWSEELNGQVAQALADTQDITLVIRDGEEAEMFGKGEKSVTVEKQADETYKVVKEKKEAGKEKEFAKKRIAQRMSINFSDECKILLGLDSIEGADATGGMVLTRLTTEVHLDEDWEKRRLEWVAMYEKLGRYPVHTSENNDEKSAGRWQSDQRKYFKKKSSWLTPERIEKLNKTKGWIWESEDTWEKNRQHWISLYEKIGRSPSSNKDASKEEKRAAQWQMHQRKYFKRKSSNMYPERIEKLNNTKGWRWEDDDTWEINRQHWISQYKKLGRKPYQSAKDKEECKAGNWQAARRKEFREKISWLTPLKINILNSTEGWTWEDEDTWEINRQKWIEFYNKLGKKPNSESKDPEEKKSGIWQWSQRQAYRKKASHLTNERINILNNSTPGWTWEEEDKWEPARKHWIEQYNRLGKVPSSDSKDIEEVKAGRWRLRQNKNKKTGVIITTEQIRLLNEETPGWTWIGETWDESLDHWKKEFTKKNKSPTSCSKDQEEKKAGKWQSHQRDDYKNKRKCMTTERIKILESTPGWSWSNDEAPKTPYIPPTAIPEPQTSQPKPRIRKVVKPKEESSSGIKRQLSQLEEFHKRFKTMNASTYKASVSQEDFTAYHAIADSYDAKDPIERQPLHKISALLSKYNKPSYTAIDLGCGKNRLRKLESVAKMKWTSIDVYAIDDTVTIADMSYLPYEDETYDIAVLGRSLWARNHMDVLKETFRILKSGGRAILCESFRRWLNDKQQNTLLLDLKTSGFEILEEHGTSINDTVEDVFQYIVVRKP